MASACAAFLVVSSNGADLATWEANGLTNSGPSPFAPATTASNITVGGLARGSALTTGTAGNTWGGTNWFVTGAPAQDAATAITNNRFVYFTVTPNSGYKVSFSAFSTFNYRRSGTGASLGIVQVEVGTGNGFTNITAQLSYPITASAGGSVAPIDLSTIPSLQNIPENTVVTFRMVNYAATATTGTWYINNGATVGPDLVITGAVEPFTTDPDLTVTKTHTDTFTQGDTGRTYTLTATNSGVSPTTGTVTLTDTLPAGLTATAMSGTGWTIDLPNKTATRSDALAPGNSYDPVTVTVNVSGGAPASVTNVATVSGGGETNTANNTASDPTTIVSSTPSLTVFTDFDSLPENGGTVTATVYRPDPFPSAVPALTVNLSSSDTTEATVPATVVIPENELSATFTITGVPDGTFDPDAAVTMTASTAGFNEGTKVVTVTNVDPAPVLPPTVVINKYLNASTELVELLVVGDGIPGHTVDMNGMVLKDFSGSIAATDNGGKRVFANAIFNVVPVGTLIVISNVPGASNATTTDTDASDFLLRVALDDDAYFSGTTGSFDIAATEMVMIKSAGSPVAGWTGAMCALASGTAGSYTPYTSANCYKTFIAGSPNATNGPVITNTNSSLADFNGAVNGTDGTIIPLSPSSFGLANGPSNLIYIRALRGITTADGTGTASIVNATPAITLLGHNIFDRNQAGQSVALTLTGGIPSPVLNSFSVTVPVTFGIPLQANCTVTGAGAGTPVISVSGQTVTITGTAVNSTDSATLTISGLSTPDPTGVTEDGNNPFAVQTSSAGGFLTPITTSPFAVVIIPISALRDTDANGVPLDLGKTVAVSGVVTEENFNTLQTSGFIQDGDFGINVFSFNNGFNLIKDHRYVITGSILQFSGLTEISPPTLADAIDLGADTAPTPLPLTAAQIAAPANPLDLEAYEGRLVTVTGLSYVSGTWAIPANTTPNNVVVTDGSGNNITIRLFVGSSASTVPNYPITVTGIFSQSDNVTPFDSAYAIMPRSDADVVSAPLYNYAAWTELQWPGETDLAIIGFDADPDGDSIPNGIEHPLGLDPKAANTSPYLTLLGDASSLAFSHPRTKNLASDVTISYEWSLDLQAWYGSSADVGGVIVTFTEDSVDTAPVDYDIVSSHASVIAGSPTEVFIRIRATK